MHNVKPSFVRVLVVVLLVLFVGLTSCDTSDNGSSGSGGGTGGTGTGQLVYQGETTPLHQLWFVYYGEESPGVYNIDLFLLPNSVDFINESGTGRFVYLEMFFGSNSVSAGTYNWTESFPEPAGTFSDFSDISLMNDDDTVWHDLTDGTVTISISGSTYTVSGTVTTDEGGTASFSYEGPLTGDLFD